MKKLGTIILFALMFCANFSVYAQNAKTEKPIGTVRDQTYKYQQLMTLIDAVYVDKPDLYNLTEKAVISVLAELDPHSVYISAEEVDAMNEPLEGGFFGIGIQFALLKDTLAVIDVVKGGPSEKVGLRPGDRIIKIDNENVAGVKMSNNDVRTKLKGPKGSIVVVTVKRGSEVSDFRITRDKIPLNTIDAAYMLDGKTGYINISKFGATTVEEFDNALIKLNKEGMKDLIIDLQNNGGGYLGAATGVCDELLESGKLVVYTQERSGKKREDVTRLDGKFENGRVVVLVNSYSASASEICSGAIQDWDRGIIVGRRTFGKGLVQRQFPFSDGTMIRLTTAHYYTPSGRCIQKQYVSGHDDDYEMEVFNRNAELYNADSLLKVDSLKCKTLIKGRTIYGGGGIIPDVFVPIDTTINYRYPNMLASKGVIGEVVTTYVDKNRKAISAAYPTESAYNKSYVVPTSLMNSIYEAGEKAGVKKDSKLLTPAIAKYMSETIKAMIARDLWGMEAYYKLINKNNDILNAAIKALKDGSYEKLLK